jgi:hypothetical protein
MNYDGADGLEFGVGNTKVDPAVLKGRSQPLGYVNREISAHIKCVQELPEGCKVTATDNHGVSFWARTGRIDVSLSDGTPQSFFIKVISKERGRNMVMGEFESMSALHDVLPEFVPKPIAWGTYATIPDTHFFLCAFREMIDDMPEPHKFAALLSTLVAWEDRWETFFAKSMRWALDLEIQRKGPSEELDVLSRALFDKVIPRLLRPLESDGRNVKPSLVHGDLWYANAGIDVSDDQPLVFDACCFFAHNECKFNFQRNTRAPRFFANMTDWKMSLASGDQPAIGSGPSTSLPTTHSYRFRRQKRTSKAVWISTGCKPPSNIRVVEGPSSLTSS